MGAVVFGVGGWASKGPPRGCMERVAGESRGPGCARSRYKQTRLKSRIARSLLHSPSRWLAVARCVCVLQSNAAARLGAFGA